LDIIGESYLYNIDSDLLFSKEYKEALIVFYDVLCEFIKDKIRKN
jgi:hypothetical protein